MRILGGALLFLILWILVDLLGPWRSDLRRFDAVEVGRLETDMWRAYYDHEPLRLGSLLVETLRKQSRLPFWRACLNAYRAARAATVFQRGSSRPQYLRALPYLESYYSALIRIGRMPSDPSRAARAELEWWIVHRERERYGERALADAIAAAAAEFYSVAPERLVDYARARAVAMLERDRLAAERRRVSDAEWRAIESKLVDAYRALAAALRAGSASGTAPAEIWDH